jgi:hypothetical protein
VASPSAFVITPTTFFATSTPMPSPTAFPKLTPTMLPTFE